MPTGRMAAGVPHKGLSLSLQMQMFTHFVCFSVQTLMDKEKREAYDAIAGFSDATTNPFHDTSYERNQVWKRTFFVLLLIPHY